MSTNIMIPAGFAQGKVSTLLQSAGAGDELGAGIRSGFGIIGYRGKTWSTKFQGEEKVMMREDGDGPKASIEVIIVKGSASIAKIFYESGFVDGSTAPPDCWSTNGVTPDGGAPKKQSNTCAGCPKNAWGSKVTEAGKQTKACSDSKRLAVVPLGDVKNELMGGTMLLRVPAASLKDLKAYGDSLQAYGYPYFGVATRIAFDINEAFPKFVFTAVRPLTDAEAALVLEHRDSKQTNAILNESVEVVQHEPAALVPASPFEQGQPALAVTAQASQPVQPVANPAPEATQGAAPVQPVAPQTPATPGAAVPRKRRTKEEMAAAAAEVAARRAAPPVTPAAPVAAAPVVQPTQPAPATTAAPDDFENQLDALLDA